MTRPRHHVPPARDDAFLIIFAVLYVIIGVPLHWRIGTNLNSRSDRVHMFMSAPMEYWAVWYPTFAMVVFGILAAKNGSTGGAWAIGIVTLVGLMMSARLGRGHWDRRHGLTAEPTATGPTRKELAATNGFQYRKQAAEICERWREGYGAEVDRLSPVNVLSGKLDGWPFTVFDTKENVGPLSARRDSLRTICLVQLPVALPDVRLRGRLVDESDLIGSMPAGRLRTAVELRPAAQAERDGVDRDRRRSAHGGRVRCARLRRDPRHRTGAGGNLAAADPGVGGGFTAEI